MKRKFTLLAAALMLLSCLAVPLGMWGQITIDFEDNQIPSGWTNNNDMAVVANPITNTGTTNGSYCLSTNGKASNSLTSGFIENIVSISVDATRTSTNTTNEVYIDFCPNTSFGDSDTQTQSVTVNKNSWSTSTLTLSSTASGYVRIRRSGGNSTATKFIDNIVITVGSGNPTYTLEQYSTPADAHGTITFSPSASVEAGTEVTLMATPADGYDFVANSWVLYKETDEDIVVDQSITVANNKFQMPAYDLWVDATFTAKPTYDITCVSTMEEVASLFATPESAYEGQTVTLSYLAEPGYFVESIAITKTSDGTATGIIPTASGEIYTFTMPAYEVTATATIAEKVATFTNGVYSESLGTQASFNNMSAVSVEGENGWYFESDYSCATIEGAATGDVDWLISPKMAVNNGKLNLSFLTWHNDDDLLTLKWSTTSSVYGEWTDLEFDEVEDGNWYSVSNVEITTNASHVYVAFVYDNTDKETASEYSIKNFVARQYYNVTFDANNDNATGTMADLSCAVGVATALTANSFAVAGQAFTGWNTQANGGGTPYSDGANITITANTTLYAQWANAYTVSFTTNGIADGTKQVVQGQAIGVLPEATAAYIPAGYTFVGWYNGEDITNPTQTEPGFIEPTDVVDSDLNLKAVFAVVSGSSSTGTLTGDEIASNFANPAMAYSDSERSFVDGDFTWSARCNTNTNRHWIQLKDNDDVYIKIVAPGSIQNVEVTISNTQNESGGIDDITKHGAFDATGHIYLNTSNGGTHVGTTLGSAVDNNIATVVPTGDNSTLYLQVDKGARIWGITVISGSVTYSNYRTSYTQSCTLTIDGYGESGGWCLIASPVAVSPSTVAGMTVEDPSDSNYEFFDLYCFDQTGGNNGKEWKNYKQKAFNLVPGKGYLYAKKATNEHPTYSFTLAGTPYQGDGEIDLIYSEDNEDANMWGWNLVGNPFNVAADIYNDYLMMNEYGTQLIPGESYTVEAMQGVFVQATDEGEIALFEPQSKGRGKGSDNKIVLNVSHNLGSVIDRAIVRFGNSNTLPKLQLFKNSTKLYIPQNGKDYAIAPAEAQDEMPVNFRANENGQYTLTVNPEGVEMNYLHLIDNMTGADINLLQTPSYTFNATTTDYESRFRLVFAGASTSSATDESFAFYSNGNWIINNAGEATLQVIDITGRILSSETVNGSVSTTLNATPGVYMLRLINGENVKVQKIVVR